MTRIGRHPRSAVSGAEQSRASIPLIVVAAVGAAFLLVVAVNRWGVPSDEHAYWLAAQRLVAGQPLYDPTATAITPYAYWYPPVLAQVLVPVSIILPSAAFTAAWTVMMLVCLWWLAGRRVLVALAMVAFPPVAIEFWFRNIHLVLAVMVVLAVRRGWLFSAAASIKLAPGLGIPWLFAAGRRRDAAVAVGAGAAILAVSVALAPDAWRDWISIVMARGPNDVASFLPIPYGVRAVAGLVLALVAGRARAPWSGVGLVVAVTIALPTLWMTGLSLLIAIVPIWRLSRGPTAAGSGEGPA